MTIDFTLEIIGTIVGILYLYYEYKANALVWIMGAIMPALSLIVYYNAGLYADFGINIYYLIAAIYGYIAWTFHKSKKEKKELPITSMPLRYYIPAAIITIILFIAISYILIKVKRKFARFSHECAFSFQKKHAHLTARMTHDIITIKYYVLERKVRSHGFFFQLSRR